MVSIVNKNLLIFNPNITYDRVEGNQLNITDGSNIIPTYNGYSTGLGYKPLFFMPYSRNVELKKVVDLQDDAGKLIITNKYIYRYSADTGDGTVLLMLSSDAENVSVDYIGSYYYILCDQVLFKYDHLINSIQQISPTGFPQSTKFICATNNRLIALSDDVIAWSAVGNGDDFQPSTTTGAGFQSLDSLSTGKGIALAKKKNGFLVFTSDNVISATELNTALVYNFKEVSKHRILNRDCCLTSTFGIVYFIDSDKNLYSYEDLGSLGSGGFKVVNEMLIDYFNSIDIDIEYLDLLETRYLVVNYYGNILGIDLLLGRVFKVQHSLTAVRGFNFINLQHFWNFEYRSAYNTEFNEISYYGNRLHVESIGSLSAEQPDTMCASINLYSELPLADVVITHLVDKLEPTFNGLKLPLPMLFDEDLNDSLLNEDLNDSTFDVDLNDYDNTWSSGFELSCGFETDVYQQAKRIDKVDAFFEFNSISFAPEIPIECTTVITRIDTNMSSNRKEFIWDCQLQALQLDCSVTQEPDFEWNQNISMGYDVSITLTSSTDAYGNLPHHKVLIEDKYFVGRRLVGNIYNTGIYHMLNYAVKGFCEITGIQFNLFKGGLIYDR